MNTTFNIPPGVEAPLNLMKNTPVQCFHHMVGQLVQFRRVISGGGDWGKNIHLLITGSILDTGILGGDSIYLIESIYPTNYELDNEAYGLTPVKLSNILSINRDYISGISFENTNIIPWSVYDVVNNKRGIIGPTSNIDLPWFLKY